MRYPFRKSTRIPDFDYSSANYYFITICTQYKRCLFGTIKEQNQYGKIASDMLMNIEQHFSGIHVDKYVIMPNHVHLILVIKNSQIPTNLNTVIGLYKSGVSREIHKIKPGLEVWQRSFHDHVIRNQRDYEMIWSYIDTNPLRWEMDRFYTV